VEKSLDLSPNSADFLKKWILKDTGPNNPRITGLEIMGFLKIRNIYL
jgi:hypothetical protein